MIGRLSDNFILKTIKNNLSKYRVSVCFLISSNNDFTI